MLRRVISFITRQSKRTIAAGMIIIVAILVLAWQLTQFHPTASPPSLAYDWAQPNVTTEQTLQQQAGKPAYSYSKDGYTIEAYNSDKSEYLPDQFYVKSGIVVVKELNFNPIQYKLPQSKITDAFGRPDQVMYDNGPVASNEVDIYRKQGMAVYVRTDNQLVIRIQFFQPSRWGAFKAYWGQAWSKEKAISKLKPD